MRPIPVHSAWLKEHVQLPRTVLSQTLVTDKKRGVHLNYIAEKQAIACAIKNRDGTTPIYHVPIFRFGWWIEAGDEPKKPGVKKS